MALQEDFCSELRAKTKAVHDESDRLVKLKLAVVLTDTKLYADMLSQFYFVFRSIEECMDRLKDTPLMRNLYIEKIFRKKAFERDLEFFLGPEWKQQTKPSILTQQYCDRIFEITETNPLLLIAYIHSMYLALLAGGQILKQVIKKTLGLSDEQGLNIFEFHDANHADLRKLVLNSINSLELNQVDKDVIIQEVFLVFQMNNSLAKNVKPSWRSYRRLILLTFTIVATVCVGIYVIHILK